MSGFTDSIDSMAWLISSKDSPSEEIEREELKKQLEQSLLKIPIKYRFVIIMYNIQGFSYNEIAKTIKCSVAVVKSRLNYGRNLLRKILVKSKMFF